ncbi:hypothetical protein BHE74_00036353 [Ensete ventricosum]|nr:hypothetical protein BHE74_00036353 [Ensete ventricosum]
MARKKIREYDSKRLLKENLKRLAGTELQIRSAQVPFYSNLKRPHSLAFPISQCPCLNKEPWLSSTKLVVKPDMLFGKRGKSGLVALNMDLAQAAQFVKERLGTEVRGKLGDFIKGVFTVFQAILLQTSASLKFTVLNPKGRIWTMVAGGGASVIYADTVSSVGDLGYASELGNYAEYSGAPNEEEVLQLLLSRRCSTLLQVYGPEATMTGICKQAIDCIVSAA